MYLLNAIILGGLAVFVLAVVHKVAGSKPTEDDKFLRAIKIRSTLPSEGN
jgi:hypothetical protein